MNKLIIKNSEFNSFETENQIGRYLKRQNKHCLKFI